TMGMKLDRLAGYAWGVLTLNLGVILWGAYVRATGSGAGCGSHWPLCNGEVLPRSPGLETFIEFTHRASSGLALLAEIVRFLWARRARPAGHPARTAAALSLVFIVVEALLGAGLVLFELVAENDSSLRAFSMVAHLVNTFILVAVLALTAWFASGGRPITIRGQGNTLLLLGGALLALLVVGGTGAIAALGDTLFPSESLGQGLRNSFSSEAHPLIKLLRYHPLLAIFVGLYVAVAARYVHRRTPSLAARRLRDAVGALYLAQLLAGTVNMVLLAPVTLQMVH